MVITKWWSRSGDRGDLVLDFIWTTWKVGLEVIKCALVLEVCAPYVFLCYSLQVRRV